MSAAALMAWLAIGAALGAALAALTHAMRRSGRRLLGLGLVAAALVYVGFAFRMEPTGTWLLVEVAGAAIYGSMGLLSLRGSAWWLVAGWGLHPLWDGVLHHPGAGPGAGVVPAWYTMSCLSFDLVVAVYVLAMIRRGRWRTPDAPPVRAD